ncbi:hypothetical protein AGABI2DRAFT_180587 [Agaricus bisporus var. bisporus H97]|uniref:hypothetical protein n=1 Tax=Agaricus bisporus var. bisporus (strain H97 / ATCC MYA-4626 / FGSC 10389) TaxID=936046 RepID=UPI00029F5B96|nr:hypothetical protein AGABI2DRAFT_180587 [Agaricus bisporus var. bisporus H97]EKV43398.1 hypothetical protein AGABI2DRAFT_180587 [Agaricus bisporus var. bisporus H97]
MKPIASATILVTLIAIVGVQGRRQTSTVEQAVDSVTATGTATDAVSPSFTDTALSTATLQSDSDSLKISTDSESDAAATSILDDETTDTWTDDSGFIPAPSMIASHPPSIPPKLTPMAGPAMTYASTSMFSAATTPTGSPNLAKSRNAGSRVGLISSEWLVLSLVAAVAAVLL